MADDSMTWFAAVDWGSERHQACLLDATGELVAERDFAHGGASLAALCDWPCDRVAAKGAIPCRDALNAEEQVDSLDVRLRHTHDERRGRSGKLFL